MTQDIAHFNTHHQIELSQIIIGARTTPETFLQSPALQD